MALTDFLKQIADSIRSKDGTTEPIVASTFPQRILDIQSGSGDSDFGMPEYIYTGTVTPEEDIVRCNLTIQHGMGVTPIFAIVFVEEYDSVVGVLPYSFVNSVLNNTYCLITGYNNVVQQRLNTFNLDVDESTITIAFVTTSTTNFAIRGGVTYRWFAWKGSEA